MLHNGQFQGDIRVWVAFRKSILVHPAKASLWQSDLKWFLNPFHIDFFMRQRLSFHRDLFLRQRGHRLAPGNVNLCV